MYRHGLILGRHGAYQHQAQRRLAQLRVRLYLAHVPHRGPLRRLPQRPRPAPQPFGAFLWKELSTVDLDLCETGPTDAELAAIELEWPLIAAELELTCAEITLLTADNVTELDWRRLRRAERQRLRALADLLDLTAAGQHTPAVDGRRGHVAAWAA